MFCFVFTLKQCKCTIAQQTPLRIHTIFESQYSRFEQFACLISLFFTFAKHKYVFPPLNPSQVLLAGRDPSTQNYLKNQQVCFFFVFFSLNPHPTPSVVGNLFKIKTNGEAGYCLFPIMPISSVII